MPITKSAKKALRQSVRRHTQNLRKKEAYKRAVNNIKKALTSGKIDDAQKLLPLLYKALDKAAKTHAIKKNKSSRLKSRLAKLVSRAVKPKLRE
ncbi:MAG: 30S ribosomal protein S20 [Candidatus Sungbacteria bacterium]|nr:30S ribosomal protein S20 [Candidatus Sungbacteria bacterium]